MRRAAILVAFLSSSAAAAAPPAGAQLSPQAATISGQNTIRGRAILTRGGSVTCAGSDVNLLSDSVPVRTLMTEMFGSLNGGLLKTEADVHQRQDALRYAVASKTTRCDGQGYFTFKGVPDGTYYVVANVIWPTHGQAPAAWLGGDLMQRVEVTGGQTKEILLWLNSRGQLPRTDRRYVEAF